MTLLPPHIADPTEAFASNPWLEKAHCVGAVLWYFALVESIAFQPTFPSGTKIHGDQIGSFVNVPPSANSTSARPMKVFIVSNLYNNEYILPTYTSSLNNFIHTLGTENVFVSIYESHSTDCTKSMLAQLDRDLHQINVSRRILLDDRATRKGKLSAVSDRVDFLANVRNTAMQPLVEASVQFTHVLWINGIVFTTQDALNLLRTNNGHYDQACAMDFIGNGFYDTWLTRDTHGDTLKRQWPYLKSGKDVDAMRHGKPFEVNSCWNGISAFDAKWFYPSNNGSAPRSSALESVDEDGLLQLALKFRASEASMPVSGMSVDIVRHPSGDLSFTPYDLDQPGGQSGLQPQAILACQLAHPFAYFEGLEDNLA